MLEPCMPLFHTWTFRPISTKFCTYIQTNSVKVLNTRITPPTLPLDPGVPQTSKLKCITDEKTLCNVKCPDGYPYAVLLISWARLASIYKKNVCTYLCMSLFHMRTARPISTKFCTYLQTNSVKVLNTSMTPPTWPPDPMVSQFSKLSQVTGEKTLCDIECSDGYP